MGDFIVWIFAAYSLDTTSKVFLFKRVPQLKIIKKWIFLFDILNVYINLYLKKKLLGRNIKILC